jgi:hypothetical protein
MAWVMVPVAFLIQDPMIHCSLVNTLPVEKKTQKIVGG